MSLIDCTKNGYKCKAQIDALNAEIDDHYAWMGRGLPSMDTMIADGRAKPFTTSDFQQQFKRQFKQDLRSVAKLVGDVEWIDVSHNNKYRLPYMVVMEIIRRSKVDRFKYVTAKEKRQYICVDFCWSLYCEWNAGPWYDSMIGIAWTPSHALNLLWFSDDERIHLLDPQNDGLYPSTTTGTFTRVIT